LVPRAIRGFNGVVLSEEALILLATLVASGLLVLGVAELAWPATARRRPARRTPPTTRIESAIVTPFAVVNEEERESVEFADAEEHRVESIAEPQESDSPPVRWIPHELVGSVAEPSMRVADEAAVRAPAGEPRAPKAEARRQVLPVDTCRAMYRDRRFPEVVSLGSAALEVHVRLAAVSDRPHEAAALLDLVGLSKQELGDRDGAREAFRAAIRDAEAAARPTYITHLVTLARTVVDTASDILDDKAEIARLREVRATALALADAVAVASGDEGLLAMQGTVREVLSSTCERLVERVVGREVDEEARALLLETLADETMPPAWRERLLEQLAAASSAEIGQLTAQAIRSVQDGKDADALEALERAERLANALPSGAVADERSEEFERRLWWGYTKVGLRRIETRNFEAALEPLVRALELGGVDEERLAETRSALVRALDGVVDTRGAAIARLGRNDAQTEIRQLAAMVNGAREHGLGDDDLADVLAKLSELEQGQTPPS
jgi:hypothetical protein